MGQQKTLCGKTIALNNIHTVAWWINCLIRRRTSVFWDIFDANHNPRYLNTNTCLTFFILALSRWTLSIDFFSFDLFVIVLRWEPNSITLVFDAFTVSLLFVIHVETLAISLLMQPSTSILYSPSSRVAKIRRHLDVESSSNLFLNMMNLYLVKFEARWILNERAFHGFIIFVYLKVNLDLEKTNDFLYLTQLYFAAVNLNPTVFEKRWTDSESWPNEFVEEVNKG